eukprot:UN23967
MNVKTTEMFLRAFEKKFSCQNMKFCQIFQPHFELNFFKISTVSFFLSPWVSNYSPRGLTCPKILLKPRGGLKF